MNVLLAVCGSIAIGPNIISMLRDISYINKIVGIDTNSDNPGKFLVDKFHQRARTLCLPVAQRGRVWLCLP